MPAGATALRVERPDGSVVELAPGTAGGASVTFTQTDLLGVYTATAIRPAPGDPSASPPTASPTPNARRRAPSAGASSSPGTVRGPVDPNAPIRFAVDLFDVAESTILPGVSPRRLEKLGHAAPGARRARLAPDPAVDSRPPARDELWFPIVLLVLVGLCVEWVLYHRDVVTTGLARRHAAAIRRPARGNA